jgi:hypothetical protein
VHIGWAVLIGWYAVRLGHSRWRWLVLAHPTIMSVVVVVTANHYWLDGIVAIGLLVVAIAVEAGATAAVRRSTRRSAVAPLVHAGEGAAQPGWSLSPPASAATPSLASTAGDE